MADKTEVQSWPINSDEVLELGQKSINAIADMTRQNMEMMLAVAQVATQSFQSVVGDVADFSKKSVERASVAARAMTAVTSPAELAQLQADFANIQFEATRAEISKYAEAMFRSTRDQLAEQHRHLQPDAPATTARKSSRNRSNG